MREHALDDPRARGRHRGALPAPGSRHRRGGALPPVASLLGCVALAALLALSLTLLR